MYSARPMHSSFSACRRFITILLLAASLAHAQILEELSFGHTSPLSPRHNEIPFWKIKSEPGSFTPSILSDRVTLTPPSPGYVRSALWSTTSLDSPNWTMEMAFRAAGPERGSGNIQLWLTRDSGPPEALRSIYTVERFEGMAIVLDQYGGGGGSVRGFLNDGSVDYHGHHNVDSLAFGHCEVSYRNQGRFTNLLVEHSSNGLEIRVDGQACFRSSAIQIPTGYKLGVTAATGETPDSIELSRLVTTRSGMNQDDYQRQQQQQQQQQQQHHDQQQQTVYTGQTSGSTQTDPQLMALVQSNAVALQSMQTSLSSTLDSLKTAIGNIPAVSPQQLQNLERRITNIESIVSRIQGDIEGRDYKDTLSSLQRSLGETREELLGSLPRNLGQIVSTSSPSLWFIILVVLGFQAALAVCYIVYKKRRANSPKKLL